MNKLVWSHKSVMKKLPSTILLKLNGHRQYFNEFLIVFHEERTQQQSPKSDAKTDDRPTLSYFQPCRAKILKRDEHFLFFISVGYILHTAIHTA